VRKARFPGKPDAKNSKFAISQNQKKNLAQQQVATFSPGLGQDWIVGRWTATSAAGFHHRQRRGGGSDLAGQRQK
jgi:hypothetical protein